MHVGELEEANTSSKRGLYNRTGSMQVVGRKLSARPTSVFKSRDFKHLFWCSSHRFRILSWASSLPSISFSKSAW